MLQLINRLKLRNESGLQRLVTAVNIKRIRKSGEAALRRWFFMVAAGAALGGFQNKTAFHMVMLVNLMFVTCWGLNPLIYKVV